MPGTLARKRARLARTSRDRVGPEAADAPAPVSAEVDADAVTVRLSDGRAVSFPLAWSPRLLYATADELADVEVSAYGVHWPQLDEDLSVRGILAGRPSQEGPESVERWRALVDRRRARAAAGEEPEPHSPALPLPDWWNDEADDVSADTSASGT